MQLNNTTVLPITNPYLAKNILSSHFAENDKLTVVIFGDDTLAENTVEKADIRADGTVAGIPRTVIWMKDLSLLPFLKSLINNGPDFMINGIVSSQDIGISISMNNTLMDVILQDPEPDFVRIELAFINAGK